MPCLGPTVQGQQSHCFRRLRDLHSGILTSQYNVTSELGYALSYHVEYTYSGGEVSHGPRRAWREVLSVLYPLNEANMGVL